MELPAAEIDKAVHLTDPERTSLVALQNTDTQAAADLLKASCGAEPAITPPGRLAAVHKRLDMMLASVKTVNAALNDFYGTMSDEQKAKFEAIGPIVEGAMRPSRTSRACPGRAQNMASADWRHYPAICAVQMIFDYGPSA